MPAQLLALTDGPSILLDKPILLLGRHPECDIQIESRKVSRRHCCIAQVGNYLVVRDLGSTNGIRINGIRTLEGSLKPGDELTIGSHRYQVQWDDLGAVPGRRGAHARPAERAAMAPPGLAPVLPASEDLRLEECDEPVPLAEAAPARGPVLPAKKATHLEAPAADNGTSAQAPEASAPHVLPDELELAPSSDVLRSRRPPPSESPPPS